MTKISFDVDFSEDPEKILKQIQDRAKAEVEKRESKERVSSYLSKLHEKVNEDIKTEYKSVTDLVKALSSFASPALKDKLSDTSASGRRKTVSMNKATFDEIKELLAKHNPNKAAIGREVGVSVVQVRKVAAGGYDKKFEGDASSVIDDKPISPTIDPPKEEETAADLPKPLSFGDVEPPVPPSFEDDGPPTSDLPAPPAPPSFGDDGPPAPPSFEDEPPTPLETASDLPEPPAPPSFGDDGPPAPPSFEDEPPAPLEPASDLPEPPAPPSFDDDGPPAPPSFGDDAPPTPDLPEPPAPPPSFGNNAPPASDLPEPPAPPSFGNDEPPAPPSFGNDEPPAPPSFGDEPPAPPTPAPKPPQDKAGLTRPPGLAGKPTLSLKPGKSKTKGFKITRPPQPPPA
jgi:hypothetical protein